jgi:hypothetical protein
MRVSQSLVMGGGESQNKINVNVCALLVVYDKLGLRWRGHYILNDEKNVVVQIATMFCHGCFFSKSSPSAYILVTKK